jgi:23S rRNA pseudouridine2605 synthase
MRLSQHLAHAGVSSRRAAEALIAAGRVSIDGEVVTDRGRDVGPDMRVAVDGCALTGAEPHVVYAINKPVGVVSTVRDPQGRPTVIGLLPPTGLRLYPVGRLDAGSSGLILLTNDGDLANRLTHPRYRVPKTYRACVGGGPVKARALRLLRDGVDLEDGRTAPARARLIEPGVLELTIREGRNRQVRRMCETVGHPVRALERIALGTLRLGDLEPGGHRRLSDAEIDDLRGSSLQPLELTVATRGERGQRADERGQRADVQRSDAHGQRSGARAQRPGVRA